MKKIIKIALVASTMLLGFSACDLDRNPYDSDVQKPYEDMASTRFYRNGLYTILRAAENPNRYILPEYMSDFYVSTKSDAGHSEPYVNWDVTRIEDNDHGTAYFYNYSRMVQQANAFVENAMNAYEKGIYKTPADRADVLQYIAEAKVMQALSYARLMERFAYPYNPNETASPQNLGMMLVKKFDPWVSEARNTQQETYDYILSRLNDAIEVLPETNKENIYVSRDYALALRARVYMNMGNYAAAKADAAAVYDKYKLINASDADEFDKIYRSQKNNPELIFRGAASATNGSIQMTDLSGATAVGKKINYNPRLVPLQWVVDLYDNDDYRKEVYIKKAFKNGYVMTKFDGDPELNDEPDKPKLRNGARYMSLAEVYFILAESQIMTGEGAAALELLKKFTETRGIQLTEADPMKALQQERTREMIGEGSRLNDMIRWKLDMVVSAPQPVLADNCVPKVLKSGHTDAVPAGFHAFTWEIPRRDLTVNKKMVRNWP